MCTGRGTQICSDVRFPKNFESFRLTIPSTFRGFSENPQVSLEFSEMMCTRFLTHIIFGWCFCPQNVAILTAAMIFGEKMRYYQEFALFRSDRAYNFIPKRFWMNRLYAYYIRMSSLYSLRFSLNFRCHRYSEKNIF